MRVISWNSNGLPLARVELHAVVNRLRDIDVVGILDTRNNKAVIEGLSRTHRCLTHPEKGTVPGKGMILAIRKKRLGLCRFKGFQSDIMVGWVECGTLQVGIMYVKQAQATNPEERHLALAKLHAAVRDRQRVGPVILMGDMNAKLGGENEDSDRPRAVLPVWNPQVVKRDELGQMLLLTARSLGLVAGTGRLDDGRPTWVKSVSISQCSRIDHVLVDNVFWDKVVSCKICDNFMGSDHTPLELKVRVVGAAESNRIPRGIRWSHLSKLEYVAALYSGPGRESLRGALEKARTGDLSGAEKGLRRG